MTTNPDAEDALENALIELLNSELGWTEWANCYHELFQLPGTEEVPDSINLGRENRAEVILQARLRPALERLNPDLDMDLLDQAVVELSRDRSTQILVNANEEIYNYLKEGVPLRYQDNEGTWQTALVQLLDWQNPQNNDFFLAQQFWITGPFHTRRPDVIGFVNGLPLLLIELKKASVDIEDAYIKNLTDYKDAIPQLFWANGLIILSNGADSRLGSPTSSWEHFAQWKKINSEGEEGVIALETMLRAVCPPQRLLDIIENFTLFSRGRGETAKIVTKNHQYLGVNNAIQAVHDIEDNHGRLGVFWHTQGSGKSYAMLFFSQKTLRKIPGNWTFVIITDRIDLDDQIYKTFAAAGAVTEAEKRVRAQSGDHLQQLLQEDHRYIFTLIHKFRTDPGRTYPMLSERDDIIVITDEAHRTQYDILAQNMRNALPNAAFIGFTGTPLMVGEEKTREVFGDYVSIYNFRQSIEDQATVPLYYENRIPEVQIINKDFDRDLERLLEEAELDEAQEARLEREFAREYHIITRDDRMEKVAADIVDHFLGRGYRGKGMVVSIDKLTAGRMHAKVQAHWQTKLQELQDEERTLQARNESLLEAADLQAEAKRLDRLNIKPKTAAKMRAQAQVIKVASQPLTAEEELYLEALQQDIAFMAQTEMALVISQGQNEIRQFAEKGLDIRPHRARMNDEPLDEYFKDPAHPLRLVFVCAMWMTGFDVPSCSTIYLDKPMRNHTLMQTITRANRVFGEKNNGMIVDYIGIFRSLQDALAIYGASPDDDEEPVDRPVKSKDALVKELEEVLDDAIEYCAELDVELEAIAADINIFSRISRIEEAVEALLVNDDTRDAYLLLAGQVERLFKAVLPDRRANPYLSTRAAVKAIADTIRRDLAPPDISGVMEEISDLLDRSIAGFAIKESVEEPFDLSRIDFDALRKQFEKGRKNTQAQKLRGRLNAQIGRMVRLNKTRSELARRFQELVDDYNNGRVGVDEFFERLLAFAETLKKEEQRAIGENLNEEELAIYDLLLKPRPEMTKDEITKVKEVAQQMLSTLKEEKLVLDWRKRQQARAAVQVSIEEWLDQLPTAYAAPLWEEKVQAVYSHIYDNYFGSGQSVYTLAT